MKIYQVITRRDDKENQFKSKVDKIFENKEDASARIQEIYKEALKEFGNEDFDDYSHDDWVHFDNHSSKEKNCYEFEAEIIESNISICDCAEEYWKDFIRCYVETNEHYQDMSEEVVDEIVDEVYDEVMEDDYMFQQIDESVQQQVYDNKTFKKYEYGEE